MSGLAVQACADAHLSNFGLFGPAEHRLMFDVNDFDETLPGPWEWDVKRLAAGLLAGALPSAGGLPARVVSPSRLRRDELTQTRRWDTNLQEGSTDVLKASTTIVCAFLNSGGGTLMIGVAGTGEPEGLERMT